jgi:dihydrofolate synthase/folylpolyglutamate synthase
LIYATQAEIERALPSDELTEICKKQNLKTVAYKNTKSALDAASKNLKADEAILVCGSFFLMEDAYAWLSDEQSIK